jgi:broad specificity phosphatase PhoE
MLIVLARHGNTFGPGDTPVWVGAREDLPLTDHGRAQSARFGAALKAAGRVPCRIIAGPLQRTRIGAGIAADACGFGGVFEIDERLKEIDYGTWGGRSDTEIAAEWGEGAIQDWRERSIVPEDAGWTPPPSIIAANAAAVLDGIVAAGEPGDTVLVISSNGILRYFHPLLGGTGDAKMKTGRWSLAHVRDGAAHLAAWNREPEPGLFEGIEAE